jgi:hypothetical protein
MNINDKNLKILKQNPTAAKGLQLYTYSAACGKVMPTKALDKYSVYISIPVPLR